MALLHVSSSPLFCKPSSSLLFPLKSKPQLFFCCCCFNPHQGRSPPLVSSSNPTPTSTHSSSSLRLQQKLFAFPQDIFSSSTLGESLARATLLSVLSFSLFFVDPALAFKGGGPYGSEVTRGQDLTGKDFSGKTLIKQDFKTSILRQTNFKGAKLLGASFFDADLTVGGYNLGFTRCIDGKLIYASLSDQVLHFYGSDMSDADLRGADFSLANVTKVNLSNANLEGATVTGNTSFKGSVITGADFTDVPFREDQREYLCKVADGVNPTTGNPTKETLLCK